MEDQRANESAKLNLNGAISYSVSSPDALENGERAKLERDVLLVGDVLKRAKEIHPEIEIVPVFLSDVRYEDIVMSCGRVIKSVFRIGSLRVSLTYYEGDQSPKFVIYRHTLSENTALSARAGRSKLDSGIILSLEVDVYDGYSASDYLRERRPFETRTIQRRCAKQRVIVLCIMILLALCAVLLPGY